MRKIALVIVIALSVSGCATTQAIFGFNVTQGQLDVARSSYNGLFLAPAARYRGLPLCKAGQTFLRNQCRLHWLTVKLQLADREVEKDFNQVQDMIDTGNSSGAVAAFRALNISIEVAESLLTSNGIGF